MNYYLFAGNKSIKLKSIFAAHILITDDIILEHSPRTFSVMLNKIMHAT